jgi:type I restriction enzyme, R subunit
MPETTPSFREEYISQIPVSQRVYELLMLGTTLTQTIDGVTKSYLLLYVDWQHPERNVYHGNEEFAVEKASSHRSSR